MSLINDALKRAKQAQQDAPPADPVTQFRPVEPAIQPARHGLGLILPISLGLVALLALLLLWELSRRGSSPSPAAANSPLNVAARALPSEQAAPVPAAESPSSPVTRPVASSTTSVKPTVASVPDSSGNSNGSIPNTNLTATASDITDSNRVSGAELPPAPLKLQGIVYNPHRPSALINGRVVFVGDRVRDLKVTAIHASDVLLTGEGRTNLLSLEP
jgi:hypothetical protein